MARPFHFSDCLTVPFHPEGLGGARRGGQHSSEEEKTFSEVTALPLSLDPFSNPTTLEVSSPLWADLAFRQQSLLIVPEGCGLGLVV